MPRTPYLHRSNAGYGLLKIKLLRNLANMEKIEKFKSELFDNIFEYIQCISIFVYNRNIYYLIDYKENFELNAKISFDIYLREGIITKEQYNFDYKNYRNGIWQLTKDNFESYL